MRYLVTGGAGFIGSHLVERLLSDGHEVAVLDDFSTGFRENLRPFAGQFELIEASILDVDAVTRAAAGADFVLHEAALGSVPRSVEDPVTTHNVNTTGTLNVLMAARDSGVRRLIFAASSSAYGDTTELPKHEMMYPRPLSPYAASKLTAEHYLAAFSATYGLETVALRYFNVFGPRQDPNSQYAAVIPRFVAAALNNEAPIIFGDGEQTRDFTFVSNVVDANLRACVAPGISGQVFNIGGGGRISLNELWSRIRDLTGTTAAPVHADARAGDVRDSLASMDKTKKLLGFVPAVSVAEGLARTVDAFRAA